MNLLHSNSWATGQARFKAPPVPHSLGTPCLDCLLDRVAGGLSISDVLEAATALEVAGLQALDQALDLVYGDGAATLELMAFERRQAQTTPAPALNIPHRWGTASLIPRWTP